MKQTKHGITTVLSAILLVLGLILTLSACSDEGDGEETLTDTATGEAVATEVSDATGEAAGTTADETLSADGTQPAETQPDEEQNETITLSALLSQSKTNVDVVTTGVVFAKTEDGFLMADGDTAIFVKGGDAAIGDAVTVEGTYRVSAGKPLLSAITVKTTATSQTTLTAIEASLADIAALKGDKTDFSRLYCLHGILTVDEAGHYNLSDGAAKVTFTTAKALDELLTKDIQVTVVTDAYDASNGWTLLSVDDEGIIETPFDLAGAADEIFAAAAVKDTCTGKLNLIGALEAYPNVTLTWSVVSGDAVSVAENIATVAVVEADTNVELKLTLTCGEQTAEKAFTVCVKAPRTLALSAIATEKPEADELFYVEGTVIAKASNQSGDVLSLVLYADGAMYRVDLDEETIRNTFIGDCPRILVSYDPASTEEGSYDVTALRGVSLTPSPYSADPIDLTTLDCVTLETEDDFNALYTNPYTEVTLFKIVNPYMSRSTSSDTNFFRFGASVEQSKQGLNKEQYTGFFMRAENGINRNAEILAAAGISLPGSTDAVKFDGYTIYALGVYRGKTTMQIVIPDDEYVMLSLDATIEKIKSGFPQTTFDASTAGEFALPCTDFVTWSCNSGSIHCSHVAKYSQVVGDDETIILYGAFTYMGSIQQIEIEITLTGAPIPVYTVSDLTEDGVIAKLECVVVGMAPSHGGDISKYSSYGLYVSDGKTVALLSADKTLLKVSGYTFTVGDTVVSVGDKLYMTNVAYKADTKSLTASDGFTIEVTETGIDTSAYDYADADVLVTMTQQADLQAFVEGDKTKDVKIIKVIADESNPIYLAAQNGYLLALNYLTDENRDDTTGEAYIYSGSVWSLNMCPFAYVFGTDWTVANTPVKSIDDSKQYGSTSSQQSKDGYTSSTYSYTGTLYLVYEYTTKTGYNFTGVLAGSALTSIAQ